MMWASQPIQSLRLIASPVECPLRLALLSAFPPFSLTQSLSSSSLTWTLPHSHNQPPMLQPRSPYPPHCHVSVFLGQLCIPLLDVSSMRLSTQETKDLICLTLQSYLTIPNAEFPKLAAHAFLSLFYSVSCALSGFTHAGFLLPICSGSFPMPWAMTDSSLRPQFHIESDL